MTLIGYLDRLSAPAGTTLSCMVSSSQSPIRADLIRLIHGDANPAGPGRKYEYVSAIATDVDAEEQSTYPGSCVIAEGFDPQALDGLSIDVTVQPTRPESGHAQSLVSLLGEGSVILGLSLDEDGWLALQVGATASLRLSVAWRRDRWYDVAVAISRESVELACSEVRMSHGERLADVVGRTRAAYVQNDQSAGWDSVCIGASSAEIRGRSRVIADCFNGKIEAPRIRRSVDGAPRVVAEWRFDRDHDTARVVDVGPSARNGVVWNLPARGVVGSYWTGEFVDFNRAPSQYGAIHFHDDDLDDARWVPSFSVELAGDLRSGVYGIRVSSAEEEDVIPVVVTPGPSSRRAEVAVVLPTFTYVAYGNERMLERLDFEGEHLTDHPVVAGHHDRLLADHPEWGLSLYDVHSDGSACAYSSSLRPIPNLRPDYRAWLQDAPRHLSADLYLVDWLTEAGVEFDVITDHELSRSDCRLLAPYRVVVTGSHPEYVSGRILDALEHFLDGGGSLMYLGGNGFYWVTSQDPERPHVIEVRRGPVGTRPSQGRAGEGTHSTTGETGGLWRERGRGPNRLVSVGMTAQGWDRKAPGYRRTEESRAAEVAFLFEGIGYEEIIGDFGLIMDGSSGDELDRFDLANGSPENAVVVATSTGHSDYYQLAGEDILATRPGVGGTECPDVRSDMTLLRHDGGGFVFSVGSICFSGAISHNGYENNVAVLLNNAVRAFLSQRDESTATI